MSDTPTKNTNCLEGMACPKCGHTEDFRISVNVIALVTDEGVAEDLSGSEWDEGSHCECVSCNHAGRVCDFTKDAEETPPDLQGMLALAVAALNTAPRFPVPSVGLDSYKIAVLCDRALKASKPKEE